MAEAHSAIAFSFGVSPEGQLDFKLNWPVIGEVASAMLDAYRQKAISLKNRLVNSVYPLKPNHWLTCIAVVMALFVFGFDISCGAIASLAKVTPLRHLGNYIRPYFFAIVIFTTFTWFSCSLFIRLVFRALLSYKGWMKDEFGKPKIYNLIYLRVVKFLSTRSPLLQSFQGSLPSLPIPSLEHTTKQCLESLRPILDDKAMDEMTQLADEFRNGVGRRLQRYLWLKWLVSTNYVSDWWEQYVYLRSRAPIMINSNYYSLDLMFGPPTKIQAARAANLVQLCFKYRNLLDQGQLKPILAANCVPLCSSQYERQFNTCRIPGDDTDTLVHVKESRHIVVFNRGRYYKLSVYSAGRLLRPKELEHAFQEILDDTSKPVDGEHHLGALTAGKRTEWAWARQKFFSEGVNKLSLRDIERAAFFVALDDEEYRYDPTDETKVNAWAGALLHGKCYNRWFDKSFTVVIGANGGAGLNCEHSWADAPIMGHLWEYVLHYDGQVVGYEADGHCHNGIPLATTIKPIRMRWELGTACRELIETSLKEAQLLVADLDLYVYPQLSYGKGAIKKCKVSPDAFIQIALQLAYYRDQGKFCLTYESSMTRLYKEGRTETVRSCTVETSDFVRAMDESAESKENLIALLRRAASKHQTLYRQAMCGEGIDRHLFTLFAVSRWLDTESPFLNKVLSEPWRLSTSQTPPSQTGLTDFTARPDQATAGGGFGPVSDDGYGVSYIIFGENIINFHISSKRSCSKTDSKRFAQYISQSMTEMLALFDVHVKS